MAQSQQVCCCGADLWTRVIAWVQIIWSMVWTIYLSVHFMAIFIVGTKEGFFHSVHPAEGSVLIALMTFVFIFNIFGMIMGNVLLKGLDERSPIYLGAWVMFMKICLIFSIFKYLMLFNCTSNFYTILIIFKILLAIFDTMITTFILWVVYIFKQEVETEEVKEDAQVTYKV